MTRCQSSYADFALQDFEELKVPLGHCRHLTLSPRCRGLYQRRPGRSCPRELRFTRDVPAGKNCATMLVDGLLAHSVFLPRRCAIWALNALFPSTCSALVKPGGPRHVFDVIGTMLFHRSGAHVRTVESRVGHCRSRRLASLLTMTFVRAPGLDPLRRSAARAAMPESEHGCPLRWVGTASALYRRWFRSGMAARHTARSAEDLNQS